jgi:hypothetical protein
MATVNVGRRARRLRERVGRTRVRIHRALELPAQVEALDRHLTAIGSVVRAAHEDVDDLRSRLDAVTATVDMTRARTAELQDSVHLVARRTALRRSRTRVLFLVHVLGSWSSCRAVVDAMAASADFDPIVASIPHRFRGSTGLVGEEDAHRGLHEQGVPHLRFTGGDDGDILQLIKAMEPDVIFRQSQWDADLPDELATERLGFARTCLVPYETMNIVENVPDARTRNTAVDSAYHRAAWLVFCANEAVLETAVRDGARNGGQFRVVGHPKADHLRSAVPRWPVGSAPDDDRPGRIVWSAHHTIAQGWTDFGLFHLVADEMLAWARESDDTEFVFMPHPALLPLPDSDVSPISRAQFDRWMRTWRELPNTAVLTEADYGPTLAASDLMVTDGLSMLVEYQLFEKPVLFLQREGHRPFNAVGEQVVAGVHPVSGVDEVRRLAEKFLGGEPDPLRSRQRDIVQRLFGEGDSAARILDALRRELARERGEVEERSRT